MALTLSLKNDEPKIMAQKFHVSDVSYYNDNAKYPYRWLGRCEEETDKPVKGQLQIVLSRPEDELPVSYVAPDGKSILCNLCDDHRLHSVIGAVQSGIFDAVRKAGVSERDVADMLLQPTGGRSMCSLKLKVAYCKIHTESEVPEFVPGCVLSRSLISFQKLHRYKDRWYVSCVLKSAQLGAKSTYTPAYGADRDNMDLTLLDDE